MVRFVLSATIAALAAGCGPKLPTPPTTKHEGMTYVQVPHPPPAPRVELVPPPPSETAVWVDGHYRWTGAEYRWTSGSWTEVEPGMAYAPPTTVRLSSGELLYYEGRWRPVAED